MKTVEVPDDCYSAIKLPPEEVPARLKKELAVRLYSKDLFRQRYGAKLSNRAMVVPAARRSFPQTGTRFVRSTTRGLFST